jgi:thymidylate kinase
MLKTKLILIEGPPGSGKSTTAQKIAAEIAQSGIVCQCFWEWSPDNPITVGDDLHLGQAIASSRHRESETLQQWQTFAQASQAKACVTVMESRFWQTGVMLMYATGQSIDGVLKRNQKVIRVIQGLEPVLIYFAIDDLRAFTEQVVRSKNEEWQRAGFEGSWVEHIYEAFDAQKWFTDRGLTGSAGMLAFLEDWARVADQLYGKLPFPKIKIRNPQQDWALAMQQIRSFLGLC